MLWNGLQVSFVCLLLLLFFYCWFFLFSVDFRLVDSRQLHGFHFPLLLHSCSKNDFQYYFIFSGHFEYSNYNLIFITFINPELEMWRMAMLSCRRCYGFVVVAEIYVTGCVRWWQQSILRCSGVILLLISIGFL